jgi:hypothetical protein
MEEEIGKSNKRRKVLFSNTKIPWPKSLVQGIQRRFGPAQPCKKTLLNFNLASLNSTDLEKSQGVAGKI